MKLIEVVGRSEMVQLPNIHYTVSNLSAVHVTFKKMKVPFKSQESDGILSLDSSMNNA
jgi:hypothetical protein